MYNHVSAADLAGEARLAAWLCRQARALADAREYLAAATQVARDLADRPGAAAARREAAEAVLACQAVVKGWGKARPANLSLWDDAETVSSGGQLALGL